MKLPNLRRLFYTDFEPQYQKLIDQLSYTINTGFESLNNMSNNNVSIRDNLLASVRDVTVVVSANGTPTSTTSFTVDNANPIDGLAVIKVTNSTNSTVFPTGAVQITYTQNGNKVIINNITGLVVGNQFVVRVLAYLT